MHGTFDPYGGVDYAMCVRRTGLDAALVATARAAGADVRAHARVTDLIFADGRVRGVHYVDVDGTEHAVHANLVVGADGRRSAPASTATGATARAPTVGSPRSGATAPNSAPPFPCDDGLVLVLLQPPVERVDEFRGNLERTYRDTVAAIPGLALRLRGCRLEGRIRSATGVESYFRRSSGPGWVLVGDAGHFKDPVTVQGIRDALHYGRLLAEVVAPVLGNSVALDRALARWEQRRERECLPVYQWTNVLARGTAMTHLDCELYRHAERDPAVANDRAETLTAGIRRTPFCRRRRCARLAREAKTERSLLRS